MSNMTTMLYKGNVGVKIKIKDKIISLENHNTGLPALKRSFCNFIVGNNTTVEDIPEYIDLRYSSDGGENFETLLISRIHLSGKTWTFDEINSNYIAKFNATISYNSLQRAIPSSDSGQYRLYLYSGSLGKDSTGKFTGYYDMACLDVSAETLSNISPGTQAIIEWSMQLLNSSIGG